MWFVRLRIELVRARREYVFVFVCVRVDVGVEQSVRRVVCCWTCCNKLLLLLLLFVLERGCLCVDVCQFSTRG